MRYALCALCLLAVAPASAIAITAPRYASVTVALRPASTAASARVAPGLTVLRAIRSPFTFDLAGARWRSAGRSFVDARTRSAGGAWSAWSRLEAADAAPPEEHSRGVRHGEPVWAKGSRWLQLAVPASVHDVHAAFVDGSPGPHPRLRQLQATAATVQPAIITRAQWGADESLRRSDPLYAPALRAIFIHHTDTSNAYAAADSAAIVRSIMVYHVRSNGWNDIGYNYLVDAYGQVFEGRYGGITKNVIGAHTLGFNSGTAGIAVIGDGNTRALSSAARQALVDLVAWRLDIAHIDPVGRTTLTSSGNPRYPAGSSGSFRIVSGHRDANATDCPGSLIYPELDGLARDAEAFGGPKIYVPVASPPTAIPTAGGAIAPIHFSATLSGVLAWRVTVLDGTGATVATGSGSGTSVSWTWNGLTATGGPVPASGGLTWRIDASAANGAALPATGQLRPGTVNTEAPLQVDPHIFSPNGDGDDDTATIGYALAAPSTATLTVTDQTGAVVTTIVTATPEDAGSYSAAWNGREADGTTVAADGVYHLVLTMVGADGATQSRTTDVAVARAAAAMTLPTTLVSPNGDGRLDTLRVLWRQDEPAQVTVQLRRAGSVVATLFDGQRALGPAEIDWQGGHGLRTGRYLVVLLAETAGGEQQMGRAVTVDLSPPVLTAVRLHPVRGGAWLTLRLSEPSAMQVLVGGRVGFHLRIRRAGSNAFHLRFGAHRPRRVIVEARDLAGNRMRPRVIAVPRR